MCTDVQLGDGARGEAKLGKGILLFIFKHNEFDKCHFHGSVEDCRSGLQRVGFFGSGSEKSTL